MNRFDIKFDSVDHFCTIEVQWTICDPDGPITGRDCGDCDALPDGLHPQTRGHIEEWVRESVGPVWLEWLGSWAFGAVCDLYGVQDLSDTDGTDHTVSICHEIPLDDDLRNEFGLREFCQSVRVTVRVTAAGGSGLDTGWEVV